MAIVTIVEMLAHTLKDGSIFASVLGTLGFTLAFTAGVMSLIQGQPLPGSTATGSPDPDLHARTTVSNRTPKKVTGRIVMGV